MRLRLELDVPPRLLMLAVVVMALLLGALQ